MPCICNPCTILSPEKCNRQLFFAAFDKVKQAGKGLCLGQGAGRKIGKVEDKAPPLLQLKET